MKNNSQGPQSNTDPAATEQGAKEDQPYELPDKYKEFLRIELWKYLHGEYPPPLIRDECDQPQDEKAPGE